MPQRIKLFIKIYFSKRGGSFHTYLKQKSNPGQSVTLEVMFYYMMHKSFILTYSI